MNNISLRVWQKEDAQQLAFIANNKNIWNNVMDSFPNPYTVMDALQWINKENNAQPITKFAIEYNNTIVGGIGMILYDDVYKCSVELGYFIGEAYWNKGFACNAIGVLLKHIKDNMPQITRVFARVYEHNKASMKALEKAGFILESVQQKAVIKNGVVTDVFMWVYLV